LSTGASCKKEIFMAENGCIGGIWISLAVFLVLACPAGSFKKDSADAESTHEQASEGKTYMVGFRKLTFVDSRRGRTVDTAVWYPAKECEGSGQRVIHGAEPDSSGGPYPLILFSHGHRSINIQSSLLMQAWASHGFIIAAPNHEKNTMFDYDETCQAMMQFARPLDLRFVTDQMLLLNKDSASFLHGLIDENAIGVSGHSFGGHTTLMSAGATPNLDYLADYCRTHTSNDWDICGLQDEIQTLYPGKRIIDESDPRIKAALSLAPDGYEWFLEEGMAKIRVPIMIVGGGADDICPVETQQKPMYKGITASKYLVILEKADHLAYCVKAGPPDFPVAFSPDILEQVKVITSAFWRIHLKSEGRYAVILTEYVSSQAHVQMQSSLSK
jgi:predicted dienelactone hydrolase